MGLQDSYCVFYDPNDPESEEEPYEGAKFGNHVTVLEPHEVIIDPIEFLSILRTLGTNYIERHPEDAPKLRRIFGSKDLTFE